MYKNWPDNLDDIRMCLADDAATCMKTFIPIMNQMKKKNTLNLLQRFMRMKI